MCSTAAAEPLVKPAELPGRGRALVATRPIKPGEILLSDSPLLLYPAATTTTTSANSAVCCSHCFRFLPSSPLHCPSSSCSACFCSPRCLSSHPRILCLALSRLSSASLPPELLSPAFFLLAAYSLAAASPSDFHHLLSLHGASNEDDSRTAAALHSLLSSGLPSTPAGFSPQLTAMLLAKDRSNAFGLMEPFDGSGERKVRAYGIYPNASFFNHDCLPNACRFDYVDACNDRNTDIIVRAIHDIPQGREVCLSYFPVNWRYAERQKRLLEDYGFQCDCDRCRVEKEWKDDGDDDASDEDGGMMEDGDEGMESLEEVNDGGDGGGDFPHAYFFMRYLCDRENCGGTLAPLPPSLQGMTSSALECNVCGQLRAEEDAHQDSDDGSDDVMLDD